LYKLKDINLLKEKMSSKQKRKKEKEKEKEKLVMHI